MVNDELGHLDDSPNLAALTEDEFVAGVVNEIMLVVSYYTEDGQPVMTGPYPVDMLYQIAAATVRCTRAYDTAHRARSLNGLGE